MNEIIVVILIFALCYILILKNFDYSLYLLLGLSLLLHKELFSFYRWDLMPIRIFMLALVCASATKIFFQFRSKEKFKYLIEKGKDPLFIAIIFLWIIRGLSIFYSLNISASLLLYAFFTTIVFLAGYLYLKLKEDSQAVMKFLKFYIYLTFALTVFGFIQILVLKFFGITIGALWSVPGNIPRVGATFWDVNHYGALLAAMIPVLGVLILTEKGLKLKIFRIVMFISMVVSLLLTNSRSAWILAFISLVSFLCILLVRKFGLKGILYVILSLVVISTPLLIEYSVKSSPFRARIKQYFNYRMDSFDSHILLLTGTYQIFEKYPVLGGGYGSFFEHFEKTKIAPTYSNRDPAALNTRVPAHTIWGELIAETGVLGLINYLAICMLVTFPALYIGLKSKENKEWLLGNVITSVFIGWMVAGIFYSYNSEFFWIIVFLFSAWSYGELKKYLSVGKLIEYFLYSQKTAFYFIAILSFLMIFVGLGDNHLIPYDEAIYANISKNMINTNNYIVENWIPGKVWYEKPPLFMWMMTGTMKLVGVSSFAAKLPSAFFGFASILVVYFLAKKMFGKIAAFFSSFVLLTTTQYLYYSRMSMLDVTATFFILLSLALYYFYKDKDRRLLLILSGISIGLAVMVKGVVGFLPLPIMVCCELYLLLLRQQKLSKRLFIDYLLLIIFSAVVFLPWHIEMYKRFGNLFINNYIVYHVWDRATSAIEDKGRPFTWYLIVLKVSMRLWFIALLGAFPFALFKTIKNDKKFVFLTIWSLVIFFFFSVAKSKLVWYIIPIYPVLAIVVGNFLSVIFHTISGFVKEKYRTMFGIGFISITIITSLFYLFLNRGLVYTSDLTGSQATLLQLKDSYFGVKKTVYVDRVELPLSLFYTEGPFEEIDFNPEKKDRVPSVGYNEQLILLTKKGRFSETVVGYEYGPIVVQENGDWILWYFDSRFKVDNDKLKVIQNRIAEINNNILLNVPVSYTELNSLTATERNLNLQIEEKLK
jgi:4-amino-4-deoxy-L-arabinose transferase-like glycosyltransferase